MVSLRLPQVLRKYAADLEFVEVEATTVTGALRAAIEVHPDLEIRLLDNDGKFHHHLLLFVDGEQVARDDQETCPVTPDARIDVLISIVGGAPAT